MAQKAVLTSNQRKILALFARTRQLNRHFYLTGGTALAAFYLKHRRSYDLDFFSEKDFELKEVAPFVKFVEQRLQLKPARYQKLHDRHIFSYGTPQGDLKIEFTLYPFKSLGVKKRVNGLIIDSLKDIAANKLFAAIDRNEPKDLVDLAFLLKEKFSLRSLRAAVAKKFGLHLERLTLIDLFQKGTKTAFLEPNLLRSNGEAIQQLYQKQLHKIGKQILK